eukprot:210270-Chlamydomonas_euryale.AAC.1
MLSRLWHMSLTNTPKRQQKQAKARRKGVNPALCRYEPFTPDGHATKVRGAPRCAQQFRLIPVNDGTATAGEGVLP